MVATNKLYSPSKFVEVLTGQYYIFNGTNDIDDIHIFLYENHIETEENQLWDYPLNEIDHIVANNIPVVLVKVMVENERGDLEVEYRWFEIPAECVVDFEEV
jgi:hypothetical protein